MKHILLLAIFISSFAFTQTRRGSIIHRPQYRNGTTIQDGGLFNSRARIRPTNIPVNRRVIRPAYRERVVYGPCYQVRTVDVWGNTVYRYMRRVTYHTYCLDRQRYVTYRNVCGQLQIVTAWRTVYVPNTYTVEESCDCI